MEVMTMYIFKCYDELWLQDVMIDMVDTIPETSCDDKLALLFKTNIENHVAVKTPFGLTERITLSRGQVGPSAVF